MAPKKATPKAAEKKVVEKKAEEKKEEKKPEEKKPEAAKKPEVKKAEPKKAEPAADDKKRKAEEKPEDPAPKKEAKKAEPAKVEKKEAKEEESATGEKEKNYLKDERPKLKEPVSFNPVDTTLNVVPSAGGKLLMAMTEGGMQYLIAGARANVGVKAGRYMYEVKIVEALNPAESSGGNRAKVPMPRQLVRLGFSTSGSSPLLGESNDAVYFDSEGFYVSAKGKKTQAAQRFTRDQVISVLLNLDPKSPNANTLSLFREGERISEPQALPEHLIGKPLYPHVAFRSVTVQMLFGPTPAKALPFTCRMVQGAAQGDVNISAAPKPDAKYDVLLPVGLPDEGTFDWLDGFLEKNPQYTELSDRKIQDWAAASGLAKPRATGPQTSNDKPVFNYGLPGMDDGSVRRIIAAMASVVPRHYLIMEVKSNLVKAERQELLKRFSLPHYRKVAHVVMGEPNQEYKTKALDLKLKEKQAKSDEEYKKKKAEEERKKQAEARQKQLAEMRKKADEARKKAAEEAKKKREAEQKKKEEEKKKKEAAEKKAKEIAEKKAKGEEVDEEEEAEEAKEEEEEAKEEAAPMEVEETKEEKKEEETKEEVKEEEEEKKDEEMEPKDEGPPTVELTEEEQKAYFKPVAAGASGDLTHAEMNKSFASFTIPEKSEGFDEVKFEWQNAKASKEYLQKWVQERKLTSRIDDLEPGQWFKEKSGEWTKKYQEFQKKHKEYNSSAAKKAKDAAKKKKAEEKEKEGDDEGKDDVDMEEPVVDIFGVEDVLDVGEGEPLFSSFAFEDWALLQLRVELYYLATAFMKDVDDPERLGIRDQHLAFYYTKYFRKQLNPKYYGLNSNADLCKMIKDTVTISEENQILTTQLDEVPENVDIFVKLTEESRRERQRRIDAGDETAKLKFSPMAMSQPQAAKPSGAVGSVRPAGAFASAAVRPAGAFGAGIRPGMPAVRSWTPGVGAFPRGPAWGRK